jgi:hypothetical protein
MFFLGYFILLLFGGVGGLLGLLCPCVLGVAFFLLIISLHPSSIQDAPCPHCSGLYTLGGLSGHVKNAHPHANLVS